MPRRVPNDELLAHEAVWWKKFLQKISHHLQGFYTTNSDRIFVATVWLGVFPIKLGDCHPTLSREIGFEWVYHSEHHGSRASGNSKPPQTSRNSAIHLARISGAISTYRNWIWLTWSFHERFLPSTRVAIAGKYWERAPTAIHSARINHNGVVPKARHRFRRMSLLRVVFSLQKQNLQRISGFYHANLWSGRFRVLRSRKWTSFWPAMIITTMWSPSDLMAHMPAAQGWCLEARPKWWVGVPAWKPAGSIKTSRFICFFPQYFWLPKKRPRLAKTPAKRSSRGAQEWHGFSRYHCWELRMQQVGRYLRGFRDSKPA